MTSSCSGSYYESFDDFLRFDSDSGDDDDSVDDVISELLGLNDTDDDTLSLDSCKTMSDGLAELLGELQPLEEDLVDLGDDSESDVPSGEFVQSSPMEPRLKEENDDEEDDDEDEDNDVLSTGSTVGTVNGGSQWGSDIIIHNIQVRVPYSTVGLIVGPKGATIKHIQRTTKTTIKSPDRGAESIFEIIGTAQNVERARQEINAFVVWRGIDDDENDEIEPIEDEDEENDEIDETSDDIEELSSKEDLVLPPPHQQHHQAPPPPPPMMTPPHTPRGAPPQPPPHHHHHHRFYSPRPVPFHHPRYHHHHPGHHPHPHHPHHMHPGPPHPSMHHQRMIGPPGHGQYYHRMLPPDLIAQQIHAVQAMGHYGPPGPHSPRGPPAYVRPCYFIRPDQTSVPPPPPAVLNTQATNKDETTDMGVTRIEKKNDDKRDNEEDNQLVIHPAQSTLNPTAIEWKPFQITSDSEDCSDSTKSEVESTATTTDDESDEIVDEIKEIDEPPEVIVKLANQIDANAAPKGCPNCTRLCFICEQDKAGAVMVPCGHGGFCYACAVNIASLSEATCPTCHVPLQMALKIL